MLDPDPDEQPKATDICPSLYFMSKLNYKQKESSFDKFYGPCCEQPAPELACNEQQAEIERLRSQNAALKSQLHTQSAWINNLSKGIFSSSRFSFQTHPSRDGLTNQ